MSACPSCHCLYRDQRAVDEHAALSHAPDSPDWDDPATSDAMRPDDPRRSARRKYRVVRPDYDSMTYVDVTDDD